MRLAFALLLVCTTATADDGWRYHARQQAPASQSNAKIDVPPDPPLAAFTTRGTFYMLTVGADATPHCDARIVDPVAHTIGAFAFTSEGTHLVVAGCGEWMNVAEVAGGVDVDGAIWFRDRAACQQAIAKHQPVATDLGGCVAEPTTPPGAWVRARLDRVLVHGGDLFAITTDDRGARCEVVHADGHAFHHRIESTSWGRPIHGETDWQYTYAAGDTDFMVSDPSTTWSDGSGFGTLCAHDQHVELGPDWVDIGERYYFSATACRAALRRDREIHRWFPKPPSDGGSGVGFGGC